MAGSTLVRAAETSRILADDLGLDSPVLVPDMIERDAGEYSGLTREQIEEQYPGALAEQRWPPGWEPNDDLLHRVTRGIEHIMNTMAGDCLAVVTHGGVIYTVEDSLGSGHERIGNLGARELIIANGDWSLGKRVDLLAAEDQTVPDQI